VHGYEQDKVHNSLLFVTVQVWKITQFGGCVYHMWFVHVRCAKQPAITALALCRKRLDTPF